MWLSEARAIAPRLKWLAIICLVPMFGFLVLAQSRAAILSIALPFTVLLLLGRTEYLRHAAIAAGILALIVVGLHFAPVDPWSTQQLRTPLGQIIDRGFSYRPEVWRVGLELALQQPWFGYGLLTRPNLDIGPYVFQHPHNVLIVVLLQGGIIALGLFLWVLAAYTKIAWRQFRRNGSALLLVLMICGLTSAVVDFYDVLSSIDRVWFAIWLPVGLAIAYDRGSAEPARELAVDGDPVTLRMDP